MLLDKSVTSHKITTVALGSKKLFVINDFELAKDLFGRDEFTGRGSRSEFWSEHRGINGKIFGTICTEGHH